MISRWFPACIAAGALLLAGCAGTALRPPPQHPDQAWQRRLNELSGIKNWELKAKLAVKTQMRGGQANMLWKRQAEDHDINLYGPLGGGRVVLTLTEQGATLRDSRQQTYYADTAEELLYRVAGWRVPFGAMQYWILGIPMPGAEYTEAIDDWGRLSTLQQSGWEIEFTDYRDFGGRVLPRKFEMTALPGTLHIVDDQLDENHEVRVRVIIKLWQF